MARVQAMSGVCLLDVVLQPVGKTNGQVEEVAVALDIAQRKADALGGMVLLVINSEALAADTLVALHLNRQDVKAIGDEEIHFSLVALQRPVVRQLFTLSHQRGEDEVLGHGTLELLEEFALSEDDLTRQSCEAAQEGDVEEIDLEGCGVLVEGEGHVGLLGEEDAVYHTGEGEPFESRFILAGTCSATYGTEDELLVLATQLRGYAAPDVVDARHILGVGILAEVCRVGVQDIGEDLLDGVGTLPVEVGAGSTRHAAAELVGMIVLKQLVEDCLGQLGLLMHQCLSMDKKLMVGRPQVFAEGDGMHLQEMHLANGKTTAATLQGNAQERACGDDMVLRGILVEILKGIEGFGALLNLIEEEKCAASLYGDTRIKGEVVKDATNVLGLCEDRCQLGLAVEIENGNVTIMPATEFADGPALAYLACSLQDQWLAVVTLFPGEQTGNDVSLNIHNSDSFTFYRRKVWNISHFSPIAGAKVQLSRHSRIRKRKKICTGKHEFKCFLAQTAPNGKLKGER